MSKIETGGPAFPAQFFDERSTGMTLRDHFAGLALQGYMTGDMGWKELDFKPINGLNNTENAAVLAYRIADAMLKARTFE